MLTFDPKVGLVADDTDAIRVTVQTDWKNALGENLNVEGSTPAGQLIDSETAFIAQKDAEVLYLANQFNPLTAEGVWQDALGAIYFIQRKIAEPTIVDCVCTGLAGTVIPQGSIVKSSDNVTLIATQGGTIGGNGSVTLTFSAQTPGPIPIGANTVTNIVTVIAGWDTVNNPAAGIPGRDEESRLEFEFRRALSVAKNAHGTVEALLSEIANIQGVLDVVILENTTSTPLSTQGVEVPGHSVFISVSGGDDTEIAKAIYMKKDAGCGTAGNTDVSYVAPDVYNKKYTFKIERPDPLPFAIQVNIRLTPSTPSDIKERVQQAILNNFNGNDNTTGRVRIASTVYASRFYASATLAGVQDLVSIKIAAPNTNPQWVDEVTINANQVPVLSINDISVEILDSL